MKRTLKRESKVLEIAGIEGMATSIGVGDHGIGRLCVGGSDGLAQALQPIRVAFANGSRSPALQVRMDSFWWIRAAGRWLGRQRLGSYRPSAYARIGIEEVELDAAFGWLTARVVWFGIAARVQWTGAVGVGQSGPLRIRGPVGILTKWLSFTRLETRTKESYMYASDRVGNSFAE